MRNRSRTSFICSGSSGSSKGQIGVGVALKDAASGVLSYLLVSTALEDVEVAIFIVFTCTFIRLSR